MPCTLVRAHARISVLAQDHHAVDYWYKKVQETDVLSTRDPSGWWELCIYTSNMYMLYVQSAYFSNIRYFRNIIITIQYVYLYRYNNKVSRVSAHSRVSTQVHVAILPSRMESAHSQVSAQTLCTQCNMASKGWVWEGDAEHEAESKWLPKC